MTTYSHKKKKGPDTEEDYYIKCEQSLFKIHFEKTYKTQLESIKKDDSEGGSSNELYAPNFFPTILANLPNVPLWSGLLLGNLSRHGESKDYENYAQNLIKHPRINHTFNENFVTSNRITGISEKRMVDLYNSLLGGKQAARLDDIVALLHENILGMQKMFSDSVTTKIIKSDKTTNVLHEQWDKKRGKTCKTLTNQDGAKKDPLIDIEIKEKLPTRKRCSINKIHKTKKEKMRKVTRKTVQDKHNPVKKSLKTTSHEKRGKQPFIGLWLDNNFAKNIALMLLKGLPNKRTFAGLTVMTAMINIVGAYRALETPENQSIYF